MSNRHIGRANRARKDALRAQETAAEAKGRHLGVSWQQHGKPEAVPVAYATQWQSAPPVNTLGLYLQCL